MVVVGAEMVDRLHFGGGFVPKTRKEEGAEGEDKEEVRRSGGGDDMDDQKRARCDLTWSVVAGCAGT